MGTLRGEEDLQMACQPEKKGFFIFLFFYFFDVWAER